MVKSFNFAANYLKTLEKRDRSMVQQAKKTTIERIRREEHLAKGKEMAATTVVTVEQGKGE